MVTSSAESYELVDCNGLSPLCHYQHCCILSHVTCVEPASPRFGLKECGESSMHTHLLSARFQVSSLSPCSFVGNAAGAAIQITRLYNSGVERLKNEEDWQRVRLVFTCDLWKLATNKEDFTCMAHWVRDKVG